MVAAAWSEMEPERDATGGDSPPMAMLASALELGEYILRETAAGSVGGGDEGGREFKSGAIASFLFLLLLLLLLLLI